MAASSDPGESQDDAGFQRRLGEKISILYRIEGDPEHPYSEVVGLLQRVGVNESGARTLAVCRRDGSVVEVAEADVIRLKFIPIRSVGPFRAPASWGSD
ncbi:MAG TPA: hypothetical protein VGK51_05515 [Actinomycetota bacterium]